MQRGDSRDGAARQVVGRTRSYAIVELDPEGKVRRWNAGAERLYGWTRPEMLGRSLDVVLPEEDRREGTFARLLAEACSSEFVEDERWHVRKDGARVWCSGAFSAIRDDEGRLLTLSLVVKDATDARLANEQTARWEAMYASFVSSVQEYALFVMDPDGVIVDWGIGAQLMKKWLAEEAIGQHLSILYPEGGSEDGTAEEHLVYAAEHGEYVGEGTRLRHGTEPFPARVTLTALRIDGQLVGFSKVAKDLTEDRRRQAEVRQANELFRAAFDHAPVPMVVTDPEGRIVRVNPAGLALVGYSQEELSGRSVLDLVAPEDRPAPGTPPQERIVSFAGVRVLRQDGSVALVDGEAIAVADAEGRVASVVCQLRDVTEQRQAEARQRAVEERLQIVGKMRALAGLAGGIAHDVNNQLAVIGGHADLVGSGRLGAEQLVSSVAAIRTAAARSADLTRRLLLFAGRDPSHPEPLDLRRTLEDLREELLRAAGPALETSIQADEDAGVVMLSPGQLAYVMVSLIQNAAEAMPDGGCVRVEVRRLDLPGGGPNGLAAGPYAEIRVTDEGHGMTPEIRERAFEPFFTTKEKARNAGLGLAVVWGIVHEARGMVKLDSEPGRGATVRVLLPRISDSPPAALADEPRPAPPRDGTGESVLVVEDEEALRAVLVSTLTRHGYRVREAADGVEALASIAAEGAPDVLLTDVVMPRMSGGELARLASEKHPGVRVVFMSGYAADILENAALQQRSFPFLEKPFRTEQLLAMLRVVLEDAGPPPP
jgi:PAS domain S-box-containing protein